jgi:hypothetical protein
METTEMVDFVKYEGNCPKNVSKDAKYAVRSGGADFDGPVVQLHYVADNGEQWRPATDEHPELVEMVNSVKRAKTLTRNGSFYINEYKQVIVPTAESSDYFLAGVYEEPLKFEFMGHQIDGTPRDLDGNPLQPGDEWDGPHPGVPYVLKPNAKDIYYERDLGPRRSIQHHLSDDIGRKAAQEVAKGIAEYKGYQGGRIYVNEFGTIFAPKEDGWNIKYTYVGQIDHSRWFDNPHDDEDFR